MFSAISIEGFRGFRKLKVEGLTRFNLFIGKNNAGKTTTLESLFMLLGPTNPELATRLSVFRGIETFKNDPEDLWGWLFFNKAIHSSIVLEAKTSTPKVPQGSRKLTITLGEPTQMRLAPVKGKQRRVEQTSASTETSPGELLMTFQDEKNQKTKSKAFLKDSTIALSRSKHVKLPNSIFISSSWTAPCLTSVIGLSRDVTWFYRP